MEIFYSSVIEDLVPHGTYLFLFFLFFKFFYLDFSFINPQFVNQSKKYTRQISQLLR